MKIQIFVEDDFYNTLDIIKSFCAEHIKGMTVRYVDKKGDTLHFQFTSDNPLDFYKLGLLIGEMNAQSESLNKEKAA